MANQYCSLSLFLRFTCTVMGARLQGCVFGQTVDDAARRNFPVFSEVVKRRVLLC